MPIIRKLMDMKTSRAVNLPLSWLRFYEEKYNCKIREVAIEVNTSLVLSPVLPKTKEGGEATEP